MELEVSSLGRPVRAATTGAPGRVVLVPPFRRPGGVARCMRASLPQERESRL